jgi:ankyrin repeat protein
MKKSVKKQEAYTFSFTLTKEEEKQIKKFTDGKGAKGIHWNGTDTYLKRAICDKNTEMALLLIKAGADINALDKDGYTPLYWAGVYDNREVALQLIKKGADVNARGNMLTLLLHVGLRMQLCLLPWSMQVQI